MEKEYQLTEAQYDKLVYAMQPGMPHESNENLVDKAWANLGRQMAFDPKTVDAVKGKSDRYFTAVPLNSDEHKQVKSDAQQKEFRDGLKNENLPNLIMAGELEVVGGHGEVNFQGENLLIIQCQNSDQARAALKDGRIEFTVFGPDDEESEPEPAPSNAIA